MTVGATTSGPDRARSRNCLINFVQYYNLSKTSGKQPQQRRPAMHTVKRFARFDAAVLVLLAAGAVAGEPKTSAAKPSVADVVKQSEPSDWRTLDPENTL